MMLFSDTVRVDPSEPSPIHFEKSISSMAYEEEYIQVEQSNRKFDENKKLRQLRGAWYRRWMNGRHGS
jgi:hypothetical protein